jgi:hypothetical protein
MEIFYAQCARNMKSFGQEVIEEKFPLEPLREIEEAKFFKTEDEKDTMELDITTYYVSLKS